MRGLFALLFLFVLANACQDTQTPTIYPSKIGVDSAYAQHIVQPEAQKKVVKSTKKVTGKITEKTTEKIAVKAQPKTLVSQSDRVIPLSANTTRDTLKISYAKADVQRTKSAGQTNLFSFYSDTAKKVSIKLIAQDSLANLRINHIKGPVDSIKGGPYGKEVIFNLPTRGYYHFSISEKPTVAKPYSGTYKVEVKLLWK